MPVRCACTLIDTCLSPRRHLLRRSDGAGKVSHATFKFLVDFKEELLIEAIANKGLPQRKQVLWAIVAFQRLCYRLT